MAKKLNINTISVLDRLPDSFGHPGDSFPSDLIGSTIIRFGAVSEIHVIEGGGLVIDYRPRNSERIRRAIFGFNELGMWMEFSGTGPALETTPASIPKSPYERKRQLEQ